MGKRGQLMNTIAPEKAAAREAARNENGTFGAQEHSSPEVTVGPSPKALGMIGLGPASENVLAEPFDSIEERPLRPYFALTPGDDDEFFDAPIAITPRTGGCLRTAAGSRIHWPVRTTRGGRTAAAPRFPAGRSARARPRPASSSSRGSSLAPGARRAHEERHCPASEQVIEHAWDDPRSRSQGDPMTDLTPAQRAELEAHRRSNGEFGEHDHSDPELALGNGFRDAAYPLTVTVRLEKWDHHDNAFEVGRVEFDARAILDAKSTAEVGDLFDRDPDWLFGRAVAAGFIDDYEGPYTVERPEGVRNELVTGSV